MPEQFARHLPLRNLRIVAVEQYGAGPYGSLYLAQLGAEVIKIEPPGQGEVSRATGPYFLGDHDSQFFQTFNQNKKSLALNLKSEAGQAVLHRLVKTADAISNNLRGDQAAKLGLDYRSLKIANPKIVCAHLSAYGRDNDRASWPGYDYLMQAEAGFMDLTGEPDGPPARFGLSMVDYMTGVVCVSGLLAALLGTAHGDDGCDLDVSLFDVALHQLSYPAIWYLNAGHTTGKMPRSAHPSAVPCQLYTCADGWIFITAILPKFWEALAQILNRTDLIKDARFVDITARRNNRDELTKILDAEFNQKPVAEWMRRCAGKVPAAPVNDLANALENPWLKTQAIFQTLMHPDKGQLQVLSNPIQVNGKRLQAQVAPAVGADTLALLNELGFKQSDLDQLLRQGVISV